MKEKGKTIIFVSHSAEDVAEYAERALVLHGGRVEIEGSVKEVFSDERVVKPEAEMVAGELREKGLDLPFPMLIESLFPERFFRLSIVKMVL